SLRAPLGAFLASADAPDGFFLNVNTRPGPYMVGAETIRLAGRSRVREKGIGGPPGRSFPRVDFLVSPDAFFQTNIGAARVLVAEVLDAVGGAARVPDLYAGSGLFSLPLAARGAHVTAVEENRQAIADLEANVRLNRMPAGRLRAVAARVEDALARLAR